MSRTLAPEIELELFTHRFAAIAAEMGERLQRTAVSTNVRDRMDYSCALADADGRLVANAPHIPVHLGAMGLCIRRVRDTLTLRPGDTVVTNHPGFGGSHLPDVTLVTPVWRDAGDGEDGEKSGAPRLLGYVASRAHHAEIGGSRPGSMPPDARSLAEEGVVIAPMLLVAAGESRSDQIRAVLEGGDHPSRSVEENMADLDAALAANMRGAEALQQLAATHGADRVAHWMSQLHRQASEKVRSALERLGAGRYRAEEQLDDGTRLVVSIHIADGEASIDFTGSRADGVGGVHPGNLNATPAIVRSVVLYVLRWLVDDDLPLNEGFFEPVRLKVPNGFLDPPLDGDPRELPAVVGGNVETSQRLTDLLIKALGLQACGQGTMNNVLFGNARFGYYETVCGGAGAGPEGPGRSAVHTHMTNSKITDPEILELRYPVRLERFAIRRRSGGAGEHAGGDGAIRQLRFLEPVQLSILSQHRQQTPFGAAGGEPATVGRQEVLRADGSRHQLPGIAQADLDSGDQLLLETPGGGGWGTPLDDS